ncbi:MAG: hypothetical protein HYR88_01540 [Verrucomicrobia bacterium]|nr:hypothetical protein [Verrucomicrobiota bacterium]MBI3868376.1 hypothetical protein [Verrucomicrobiota bacterium]
MEQCALSARDAGVFADFHVVADAPISHCQCYRAQENPAADGLEALVYLKGGFSRLHQDYAVWIAPETRFLRPPHDLLSLLRASPIHVPLRAASRRPSDERGDDDGPRFEAAMRKGGVRNAIHQAAPAICIIRMSAMDAVFRLACEFAAVARASGLTPSLSNTLAYVMQMLCANPDKHRVQASPNIWLPVRDAWNLTPARRVGRRDLILGFDPSGYMEGDPALVSTLCYETTP